MSTYIGPNGRLYHRESSRGKWIAFAILCVIMISVAIVGLPSIAAAFRYAGL